MEKVLNTKFLHAVVISDDDVVVVIFDTIVVKIKTKIRMNFIEIVDTYNKK